MISVKEHTPAWLVVNTHPNRESLALENLTRQSFESYCPKIRKRLRGREALRPLFPNYVFVHVNLANTSHWRPILSTYGVRRVVRFGDQTPTVDAAFITALRAREIEGVIVPPSSSFKVGQDIRISNGAFDGIIARIIEISNNDRLLVLMNLLGQSVRGRIHADQVSPLTTI